MKIQEFSFGNFKSFKDIQTLNLGVANIKSKDEKIDKNNILKEGDNTLLKSKVIYGANASGKSNIIKALISFIRIIKTSLKNENVLQMIDSFKLSTETENEPSFFQLVFWEKGIKYRYGFEATDTKINAEWLYGTPKKRELPFFIREENQIIEIDNTHFKEGNKLKALFGEDSDGNDIFRPNSLFLSALSSFGFGKLSKELVESMGSINIINGLGDEQLYHTAGNYVENEQQKNKVVEFLKYGDIGILNLHSVEISSDHLSPNADKKFQEKIKETPHKILISVRKKFGKDLQQEGEQILHFGSHESEGTQKLFELSPLIFTALSEGTPIIIDEFDARFHPLLTKKIVELFNAESNSNSQLIITTHDTNLLSSDLLRRDQIEFVEKDKYGASHLYSLVQFKGIRNTDSFEKDYIRGKYGAIPFLGNFNKLINSGINA